MHAAEVRKTLVAFVAIAFIALLLCYPSMVTGLSERNSPVQHNWTLEEIDPSDRDALATWARDICAGLDIEAAAEAINVAPTADAVVAALTNDLPAEIRKDIATVCFDSLPKSGD
jgi:hypothetical protein